MKKVGRRTVWNLENDSILDITMELTNLSD